MIRQLGKYWFYLAKDGYIEGPYESKEEAIQETLKFKGYISEELHLKKPQSSFQQEH